MNRLVLINISLNCVGFTFVRVKFVYLSVIYLSIMSSKLDAQSMQFLMLSRDIGLEESAQAIYLINHVEKIQRNCLICLFAEGHFFKSIS